MTDNKLYDTRALAEYLGVSRWHVTALRKSGAIASVKLGTTKCIRYTQAAVDTFLSGLAVPQQSAGVRSLGKLAAAQAK